MNRLQKRSKNKTNKYYLLGYKGESICILLNAKGKVITGHFVRFAKEKRLAYDLSSDNNSEDKPLLKRGRVGNNVNSPIRTSAIGLLQHL
jgi:hypothetical protein